MTDQGSPADSQQTYIVEEGGARVDVYAAQVSGCTRSAIARMIAQGEVFVNGKQPKANLKLKSKDKLTLVFSPPAPADVCARDLPLTILYQDADIAVIDKPQGMVVHPAPGHWDETLVNAILYHMKDLSGIGGQMRPGIVHRIDKMTSGLLVIAKNDAAHLALAKQMKDHSARRTYLALVEGNLKEDTGTVDAPIGRHRTDRKRMAVVPDGRSAVTHWTVLDRYGDYTLLEVVLETGRTHQIRVHMAHIKHPVAGDVVYGRQKPALGLDGQALHAVRLFFRHPGTGECMSLFAPPPKYFLDALRRAGWDGTARWAGDGDDRSDS
ncbi:MAG: RluA family pseudouridine synthase [Bacillota bacterium]